MEKPWEDYDCPETEIVEIQDISNTELARRLRETAELSILHWNYSQTDLIAEALARLLDGVKV